MEKILLQIVTICELIYIITLLIMIKRTLKTHNKQPLSSYKNIVGNLLYKPTKPYLLFIVLSLTIPFTVYFIFYLINSTVINGVYNINLFHVNHASKLLIPFTIVSLSVAYLLIGFLRNQYNLSSMISFSIPFITFWISLFIIFKTILSLERFVILLPISIIITILFFFIGKKFKIIQQNNIPRPIQSTQNKLTYATMTTMLYVGELFVLVLFVNEYGWNIDGLGNEDLWPLSVETKNKNKLLWINCILMFISMIVLRCHRMVKDMCKEDYRWSWKSMIPGFFVGVVFVVVHVLGLNSQFGLPVIVSFTYEKTSVKTNLINGWMYSSVNMFVSYLTSLLLSIGIIKKNLKKGEIFNLDLIDHDHVN